MKVATLDDMCDERKVEVDTMKMAKVENFKMEHGKN